MHKIFDIKKASLEVFSVVDYNAFKFYKENSKKRKIENTPNYVEHGKILRRFYEKIGEKMVESSGGVFIEGLGYFGAVIDPNIHITSYFGQEKLLINRHTSGYTYHLAFVPIAKDNVLREFVSDKSFSHKVRKPFSEALKSGKKYTFNFLAFFNRYGKNKIKKIV